jgi:hypothetical protein
VHISITAEQSARQPNQKAQYARAFLSPAGAKKPGPDTEVTDQIVDRLVMLTGKPDVMPETGFISEPEHRGELDQLGAGANDEYA